MAAENCILYDWLSMTLPVDGLWYDEHGEDISDGHVFIELLGMTGVSFQVLSGVRGYSKKLWFDGVNIHLPSDNQQNCWLEMSGSGCRAFETYGSGDWEKVFAFGLKYCHVTRLDVSFDDHSGILDVRTLFLDTYFDKSYVCRANKHEAILSWDDRSGDDGSTINHGTRQSNTLVRIYDKAKQLKREGEHWVRVEMELHEDNAKGFMEIDGELGPKWCGVLLNYLRYVEPGADDSNRWRWPLKTYWENLVQSASPIRWPSKPGVEYNMVRLENYLFHQAGNSARTYIEVYGIDAFMSRLKETTPAVIPERYKKLVEDGKRYKDGRVQ